MNWLHFVLGLLLALIIVFIFRKELRSRRDAVIRFFRRRNQENDSDAP